MADIYKSESGRQAQGNELRSDVDLASLYKSLSARDDVVLRSNGTRDRIERHVRDARIIFLEDVGHILPPQTMAIAEFLRAAAGHTIFTVSDAVNA